MITQEATNMPRSQLSVDLETSESANGQIAQDAGLQTLFGSVLVMKLLLSL